MPQKLSDLDLDEVSVVDRPGNQFSKVVLIKHDLSPVCKCGSDYKCESCKAKECGEEVAKAPAGIQFNIGFKDEGGSEIQSVVFDSKHWTKEKAKEWLESHDMPSGKVDETENTLRFRQKDPAGYKRFRMITPGKAVSKALKQKLSFNSTQSKLQEAVRNRFRKGTDSMEYLWIRDIWKDMVVFDQDGDTYRAEYEMDDSGNFHFGEKVPVDMEYKDRVSKASGCSVNDYLNLQAKLLSAKIDAAAAINKINTCHNKSDGRFCETGGGSGSGSGVPGEERIKGRLGSLKLRSKSPNSVGMSSAAEGVGNVLAGTGKFYGVHTTRGVTADGKDRSGNSHSVFIKPNGSWRSTVTGPSGDYTINRGKGTRDMADYVDRWQLRS